MRELDVRDGVARGRLDHGVEVPCRLEREPPAGPPQVVDAGDAPEGRRVDVIGEHHRHVAECARGDACHVLCGDEPAVADDADAVAGAFHLVELVR
jgi:hypothetical protein